MYKNKWNTFWHQTETLLLDDKKVVFTNLLHLRIPGGRSYQLCCVLKQPGPAPCTLVRETCFTRPPLILTFRSCPENCPPCRRVFACVSLCLSVVYVSMCLSLWTDSVWIGMPNKTYLYNPSLWHRALENFPPCRRVWRRCQLSAAWNWSRCKVKAAFWWVLSICLRGWDNAGRR